MKTLLLLVLLAAPAFSAEGREANWRVTWAMRYRHLERSGTFLIADRAQGNTTAGGEIPFEIENSRGVSVEFHKGTDVVNCTATGAPGKAAPVWIECEFMLNGLGEPLKRTQARERMTAIFKTAVYLKRGKKTVVLEEPERKIELTIDEAKIE